LRHKCCLRCNGLIKPMRLFGIFATLLFALSINTHAQIVVPSSFPTIYWGGIFTNTSAWPSGNPNTPPLTIMNSLRVTGGSSWIYVELQRGGAITNTSYWNWSAIDLFSGVGAHDLLYTFLNVPTWANGGGARGIPPTDINTSATCQTPLAGTVTTDCQFKEFVTGLMQHTCGVTSQPGSPLVGQCKIKNFESWNEFNEDGYWHGTYSDLAKMAEDAAHIVRLYCGDCLFGAGSTSGGGKGYSPLNTTPYYDLALEAFLTSWKASTEPAPDFISWHPYPVRSKDAAGNPLTPVPFPETNVSGDGLGTGGDYGDASCTTANTGSETANIYCGDSIDKQSSTIVGLTQTATYGVSGKPVWATEGGYGETADLQNSDNNDSNVLPSPCAHAPCVQDQLRGGYVARWLVDIKWRGVQRAYYYSWDDPCWGAEYLEDNYSGGTQVPTHSCTYLGHTETSSTGYLNQSGQAWESVQAWLNGATRPICTTTSAGTGYIYTCTLTRTSPSNYHAVIVWYTGWLGTTSFTPSPPTGEHYTQYRNLWGTETSYSSGSITINHDPIIFEGTT